MLRRIIQIAWAAWLLWAGAVRAERINQEGRILGLLQVVTAPILFDTTNADAVVSSMQIFPVTNPWNEDVSRLPVLTNSDAMIAEIMADLSASRRILTPEYEMNYVLVPDNQPLMPIIFFNYADESDLNGGTGDNGLYPIPANLPIEGWPTQTGTQTLQQWQMAATKDDRHAIMVAPGAGFFWETWLTKLVDTNWQASNGAMFNANTNALRPDGWTSGDAAGLPMFSAIVRYDEAERGMVEHACRLVVARSLYGSYIYPATHFAAPSTNTSINLPAMGQRLRLKAGFSIPTNWTREEKAILLGLKKYGAMVADNGNFFSISVTPDDRWPANCFNHLTSVSITNFEVVQSTGPTGGPRAPGAPTANAGGDQLIPPNTVARLHGVVAFAGDAPAIQWQLYSGPGTVIFGNVNLTNTTATFSAAGAYTLMLSAADGVHAVAYDAVVITVSPYLPLTITNQAGVAQFSWTGGTAPYVLQTTTNLLDSNSWTGAATTSVPQGTYLINPTNHFFRVVGH
jgi:hypothetical protein